MPKRTATKIVYPVDPEKCRPVRHLPAHLYPLYDLMVGFSMAGRTTMYGKDSDKPLVFKASFVPTVCNALNLSENQTYLNRDKLEELGWIVMLKEGGYDAKEKHEVPDEWLVLEHAEFIKQHPGSCPPNKVRTHKNEEGIEVTADESNLDIAVRLLGLNKTPTALAIVEVMSNLTDEELATVVEHWKSIEPDPDEFSPEERLENKRVRELLHLSPVDRGQPRRLSVGDSPSPMEQGTRPLSSKEPVPYGAGNPSPMDRGESFKTPAKTPTNTPTHTAVPANTIAEPVVATTSEAGVSVCVSTSSLSEEELENEVDLLIRGFVKKDGEPPQVTTPQKTEMKRLLKRDGREKFRAAALAWLKAEPWDARTTHPFASFIGGYAGYAAKKFYDDQKAEKKDRESIDQERTAQFWRRKFIINHGQLDKDFLDSLTKEDRDYIKAVVDAQTLEALPPDNGRLYFDESLKFAKKRREDEQLALSDENF